MLVTRTLYQSPTDKALSWLFVMPVIIILLITAFIPLGWGLYLSFFRYKLNMPSATAFIGLKNYLDIFSDELTIRSLRNNVIFAMLSVSIELLIGVTVAMMLSDDNRFTRRLVSILMVPMIIAPVAAGTLWRMMLDRTYGVVNFLLGFLGIHPILWLGDPKIALYSIVLVDSWQFIPFVAVLVLSSIKAMPTSFLDAARVDGASPWKVFWRIILPITSPVIIIVAMLRFIDAFKVFDTIFVMTQGGPGNATEMLPTYIYRQGIKFLNIGYSSATAILFVIAMSVIAWSFQRLRDRQLLRLG
ncbi:MAG: sugar ABC transporter permease [Spirochaetia bacterium]|jgi:multiple sugar transport system permease protein